MRHNGFIRKRKDKKWYKSPRKIYKCFKRLTHLCLVFLLVTVFLYLTNLTLLYLNIKLPDWFNVKIPLKLIQTKSEKTVDETNSINTQISSVAPINSVTPISTSIINSTIELTVAPTAVSSPSSSITSTSTAIATPTPSVTSTSTAIPTPTPSVTSTPTAIPTPTPSTDSTHIAIPRSTISATSTQTTITTSITSTIHTNDTIPVATPSKEIVALRPVTTIDPFSSYRPTTKIDLSSFLISDVYNSKNHTLSDSNVTFSIEKNTLFITSDTYFIDISSNVGALETLVNLDVENINIQNFTKLNANLMIKEFDTYDIENFDTYWKENNGRYEVNITLNQSLLSMLFNGLCVFDLTKLY